MRSIAHIFLTLCTLSLLLSCDKLPDNGDIDSMWQLMQIEERTTGEITDFSSNQRYWSFRKKLVQYSANNSITQKELYSHFKKDNATLLLTDFCNAAKYETETDDNKWISLDNANVLNDWGIYPEEDPSNSQKVTATFHIEHLTNSSLILITEETRLTFRKF